MNSYIHYKVCDEIPYVILKFQRYKKIDMKFYPKFYRKSDKLSMLGLK